MYIEVRKAGFVNKGAELMLYSVLQKMRQTYPDADFVMAPSREAPYLKRAQLGLFQKFWYWRYRVQWGMFGMFIPKKIRKLFGIVLNKEIQVVLDVAGFSYSDQWGDNSCLELALACTRWRKQGTKVVLLPQAFGPFTSPRIKQRFKTAVENIDLLFARDRISYEHIVGVVGERENIKLAPDFTNLIEGIVPDDFDRENNKFCIVPNYRMIDKTSQEQRDAYLPFMVSCTRYLLESGQKPFVLVHESNDVSLAQSIVDVVGSQIPIVNESHPLKIKGILGASEGSIGSRFHGLVSALSQGVPVLATGWSHKYEMLLEDYDFPEGLLSVTAPQSEIQEKINLITNPTSKEAIKAKIQKKSAELKERTEAMWQQVFSCLTSC